MNTTDTDTILGTDSIALKHEFLHEFSARLKQSDKLQFDGASHKDTTVEKESNSISPSKQGGAKSGTAGSETKPGFHYGKLLLVKPEHSLSYNGAFVDGLAFSAESDLTVYQLSRALMTGRPEQEVEVLRKRKLSEDRAQNLSYAPPTAWSEADWAEYCSLRGPKAGTARTEGTVDDLLTKATLPDSEKPDFEKTIKKEALALFKSLGQDARARERKRRELRNARYTESFRELDRLKKRKLGEADQYDPREPQQSRD
eukprot:Clim_evm253s157 gene=Clim_evmTU253s157